MVDIDVKEVMSNFTPMILIFFFNSLLFDFSVTYTIFKYKNNLFVKHETSGEMVAFLTNGQFPVFAIGHIILSIILSILFYRNFMEKETQRSFWYLLSWNFILTMISTYHYFAGLSWLL